MSGVKVDGDGVCVFSQQHPTHGVALCILHANGIRFEDDSGSFPGDRFLTDCRVG